MTDPVTPPPLELSREEVEREDGRYLLYYSFPPGVEAPKAGEDTSCPS